MSEFFIYSLSELVHSENFYFDKLYINYLFSVVGRAQR